MEQYLSFLLTFTLAVALSTSLTILMKRSSSSKRASNHKLPPGPWRLPIVGNLHQLSGPEPVHRRLRDMARKYGPVMQLQLGELRHVVVTSKEAAADVLKTHDAVLASRPHVLAADIFYYGEKGIGFTPYGEYWRLMRKVSATELLGNKRVLSYRSIREEELSGNMVSRISSIADGQQESAVINLAEILFWVTNRVIARSAFGSVKETTESLMQTVSSGSDMLGGLTVSDLYPSIKFLPALTGFRAKVTRLHEEADALLEEIVNEHITRRAAGKKQSTNCDQAATATDDFVDVLLDLQENCTDLESPLTVEHVKAIATEMYLAASGTLIVTMEWIMAELMRNPRVMQKVQKEVREKMIGKGKFLDEEGLEDLKYMNAVIKEAFRLHPVSPLLVPRESQEDVVVDGYMVPAKTKVMVNVWAIGRDSRYWADPETFYPERFLDCSIDYKGRDFEFLPFGAGRRICPGLIFGMAIVKFGLANLLYHFDWKLPGDMKPEDLDMSERFGITLRRNCPLCLIPIAYNDNNLP
ncbi:unnamed protein product [Linum tenue]|uniref:Cytochrome P450 n=1 Tax=Linum tenue TaxID=586396 RepID=A0AAV0K9D9_9ROSI|nr:unnamed protein product [Linum tenue]